MTNVHRFARRQHGVTTGHLWKHSETSKEKKQPVEERKKTFCYCVLVGVSFTTYADVNAFLRGDYPVSLVRIVGANAWNDHKNVTPTEESKKDTSFRMVTSQGTHIYCTAPTSDDRNVWLGALHAGLEASFSESAHQELPPLVAPPSKIRGSKRPYCRSCGKVQIGDLVLVGIPLPQYGHEFHTHVCLLCAVAQGMLMDIQRISNLYSTQFYETQALETAGKVCWSVVHEQDDDASHKLRPRLIKLVQSTSFGSYRRVCPQVEEQCAILVDGGSPAAFLEALQPHKSESCLGELKKEAFKVAGDMGSAVKLLQEYAQGDADMLKYILEFFLDLCDEGELSSVGFFWPQLQCIHLRMLPPENADELTRVDLMEDFLITVATKYSVHLALELVWGYSADLEESLYNGQCSPSCRQRRFSVLRFICELESLLFDFAHGWGGGSVALKKMISPSPHQVTLLRLAFLQLQHCRQRFPVSLSRSVRMDKLKQQKFNLPPEEAAQEALRVARNADYFSSQLSFMRRLGDIAERLRFMELEKRAPTLERELTLLNSSGSMGGDPLNRIHENLIRVVHVPSKEGHVFRSKERTPVLLLMEVVEEGVEDDVSVTDSSPEKADRDLIQELIQDEEASSSDEKSVAKPSPSKETADEASGSESENSASESQSDDYETEDSAEDQECNDGEETPVEDADAEEAKNVGGDTKPESIGVDDTEGTASETKSGSNGAEQAKGNDEVSELYSKPLKSLVAESSDPIHHSPRALGKLKHFESPYATVADTPSKQCVVEMVNTALTNQLDLPNLDHSEPKEKLQAFLEEFPEEKLPGKRSTSRLGRSVSSQASRKMSAFACDSGDSSSSLPTSEIRREVLTTIMMKGRRGANAIAARAANSAQRSLQELDRKRAVEMILHGDEEESDKNATPRSESKIEETEAARQKLLEIGMDQATIEETLEDTAPSLPSEEDEAMDALRLLLLQYQVGQGTMSAESAALAMAQPFTSSVLNTTPRRDRDVFGDSAMCVDKSEMIEIDAGDVDPRLSGCGALPPAVLSALTLWKAEVVSNGELIELVKKDLDYIRHAGFDVENADKLIENSQFWGRFSFGERWAEKKARLAASSPHGTKPGWDLIGVIVKSNDDVRQEAFMMQLIELCDEAFQLAGLDLWLHPYRILATGKTTGVIEMVRNAMSFDSLKKRPGYGRGGLREHLKRMTEFSADPVESFRCAQQNFVSSLAAYSLLSYLFLWKDRHNGNLLLDTAGHVIHIDFGFVFGVAPGGSFSLEMSTPFKLTEEMMEVMGGLESPLFSEFVTLFCCGFLALQTHVDTFATIVEITCRGSTFKCFDGRDADEVVTKLRERFVPDFKKEATVAYALDLIKQATKSYGTKQYDYFQYLSQGIAT